jgi:hypothetical protein
MSESRFKGLTGFCFNHINQLNHTKITVQTKTKLAILPNAMRWEKIKPHPNPSLRGGRAEHCKFRQNLKSATLPSPNGEGSGVRCKTIKGRE